MKKTTLVLLIASVFLLSACQQSSESPIGNRRSTKTEKKPLSESEIIVPTLDLSIDGQDSKFKLRSQTARYLNKTKSSIELVLSNNPEISCQNPEIKLAENQQAYRITLESADKKTFTADSEVKILSVKKLNSSAEEKVEFSNESKVDITAVNNSIFRGNLELKSESNSISGEFFTALCK